MLRREPTIVKQPNGFYALYSMKDSSFIAYNMNEMELVQVKAGKGADMFSISSVYEFSMKYKTTREDREYSGENLWEYHLGNDHTNTEEELREKFTTPYEKTGDVYPFETIIVYIYPYYDAESEQKFRLLNTLTRDSIGFDTKEACYEEFVSIWSEYLSTSMMDSHFSKMNDENVIDYAKFINNINKEEVCDE